MPFRVFNSDASDVSDDSDDDAAAGTMMNVARALPTYAAARSAEQRDTVRLKERMRDFSIMLGILFALVVAMFIYIVYLSQELAHVAHVARVGAAHVHRGR